MPQDYSPTVGDLAIYPPHGLGSVVEIAAQEIAGKMINIITLRFEPAAMTIRVPSGNSRAVGLRPVASAAEMTAALDGLAESTPRLNAADWKKNNKIYIDQINTGQPRLLADVVRELSRGPDEHPLPAGARMLYTTALQRLAQELAIVEAISEADATLRIEALVQNAAALAPAD
jgi:CarD family transcriptional regulator